MQRLFQRLDACGTDYLLISGQAAVLYGAATFSEDIDVWIRPTEENAGRLLRALAQCRARVYKLTPPLTLRFLRSGHGFHFTISSPAGPVFLDVMGQPPRVRPFEAVRRRAQVMELDWGRVAVVGIEDLIALKLTRRLSDYEVVSNLVRARLAGVGRPSRCLLRWAARNTFRAEDRVEFMGRLGEGKEVEACRREIALEVARLQARDVRYWRPIIRELGRLRQGGQLLPQGAPVSSLISP